MSTDQLAEVRNPWDQSVIARVSLADAALLDRAADEALKAFEVTRRRPPHERAELLTRLASRLNERKEAFARDIVREAGKPITLAEAEVGRAVFTLTAAADAARRAHGRMLDAAAFAPGAGHIAIQRRFPVGVVYGMTPFNFPVNLVVHKLAPALAIGAPIILKPSPRTPISTIRLAELAMECGAVPGSVQVVNCENDLALKLAQDERVKVVSFTGSAAVGWQVKAVATKKKVTLELGGNAAVIVHDDADLSTAVPAIATGAFAYAGQSCISVQRILVQRRIYVDFRDRLVAHTKSNVKAGDPTDHTVLIGPMIDPASQLRILDWVRSAQQSGATVLTGGVASGPCIEPTLLENVPADHPLCVEEAFAPVAILRPYDDFAEALRIANDSRYGLQAGVFTRDLDRALTAFETLEVGGVMINQPPTMRLDNLPYGGIKDSGFGREGIECAIEEMTEGRMMVVKRMGDA